MEISNKILCKNEEVIFELRNLYEKYGYKKYKMRKFEEYDLYLENKNFLTSENIITFNDLSGRLLALKPDVTLSIAKNTKVQKKGTQKLYYNENVYRASKSTHEYKEIMQVGLECIGEIDIYTMGEVLSIAAKSLEVINENYVIDLSHLGFLSAVVEECGFDYIKKEEILKCIGKKDVHEILKICNSQGVTEKNAKRLSILASLYGPMGETLEKAKEISCNDKTKSAILELNKIYEILKSLNISEKFNLDFSIINDMNYYNGVTFQGFLEGVPCSVLSGGRYDNLLDKLNKNTQAIGFAVYLDLLEFYFTENKKIDADILILYKPKCDFENLAIQVQKLINDGYSVRVEKYYENIIKSFSYKELMCFDGKGLRKVEEND